MALPSRTRKARRLLSLQDKLQQAAEWRLAGIKAEIRAAEATQSSLMATLADDVLGPVLVDVAARRLKAVAQTRAQLLAAEAAQTEKLREDKRRVKQAERLLDGARREDAQAEEKAAFDQVMDAIAARATRAG